MITTMGDGAFDWVYLKKMQVTVSSYCKNTNKNYEKLPSKNHPVGIMRNILCITAIF